MTVLKEENAWAFQKMDFGNIQRQTESRAFLMMSGTPLSMIRGYAGQLENSKNLSEIERKKAAVIVKQSNRIKDLINALNIASKLEYDMQPLTMKTGA